MQGGLILHGKGAASFDPFLSCLCIRVYSSPCFLVSPATDSNTSFLHIFLVRMNTATAQVPQYNAQLGQAPKVLPCPFSSWGGMCQHLVGVSLKACMLCLLCDLKCCACWLDCGANNAFRYRTTTFQVDKVFVLLSSIAARCSSRQFLLVPLFLP